MAPASADADFAVKKARVGVELMSRSQPFTFAVKEQVPESQQTGMYHNSFSPRACHPRSYPITRSPLHRQVIDAAAAAMAAAEAAAAARVLGASPAGGPAPLGAAAVAAAATAAQADPRSAQAAPPTT